MTRGSILWGTTRHVPRQHIERIAIVGGDDSPSGESGGYRREREIKLGAWVGNQRSRAPTLSRERTERLSAIGMRWT
ncbi:helicase associated domain-containing protein [Streptomyces sp. enrichment culture]|uniref:helicase associated domain-containing protein n=1 Tax=Streptomyces sp. enrichment culture TaxID=1795815 RepID=UPI003F553CBB